MSSVAVFAPQGQPMAELELRIPSRTRAPLNDPGDAGEVEFPYAFPQLREYTIWVQVKRPEGCLPARFRRR